MRRVECCNRPTTEAGWRKCFREGSYCPRCRRCLKHEGCACRQCAQCGERQEPKALCPRCHSCKLHHQEKIFRSGEFPFRECQLTPATPNKFQINPLQRSLGVEVELENFAGLSQKDCRRIRFHIEHDGSVRGSGQELVTNKLCGDNYIVGMTELAQAIANRGCVAGPSTGLHVHVDAIDYNTLDLRRMFVLFAMVQNDLFGTLVASDRASNMFCPPVKGSPKELLNLIRLTKPNEINGFFYKYLYDISPVDSSGLSYEEARRYSADIVRQVNGFKTKKYMNTARRQALNFHSWMMRGTLEFRLHEGTTAIDDLIMWPLWCGWFVQKNLAISDKEVEYWVAKKPPTVLELSERFAEGKISMPKNILEWVRTKCSKKKSKPEPIVTDITIGELFGRQERAAPPPAPEPYRYYNTGNARQAYNDGLAQARQEVEAYQLQMAQMQNAQVLGTGLWNPGPQPQWLEYRPFNPVNHDDNGEGQDT